MKISLNWLREFAALGESPQELGTRVTSIGFAVETIEAAADDFVMDLDIPANRPDCLSHLGIGREVAAAYGVALQPPAFDLAESGMPAADVFSISIVDPDLCSRYCGRYIEGVRIGPSPEWLKRRLESLGVRSINNVADVTNFVMLELGQPLHAFDAAMLEGRQIIVRRADIDEKLRTLDGIERELNPSMLVIADRNRAVALAGVMGGADSEISDSTTSVLLESAHFDPISIRKTSRAVALASEASYRFERGVDSELARLACDRAAALIRQLAGGTIHAGVIDVYPRPRSAVRTTLRRDRIRTFLGSAVEDTVVESILARLGFQAVRKGDSWTIDVPSYRQDISREEDILEEIARHHGFDKFPATLPRWSGFGAALPQESRERALRNRLSAAGYSEIMPMAFSDEATEQRFRPDLEPVRLRNPMAEDEAILRMSLIPSMLRTLQRNLNHGSRNLQLYELGKVYNHAGEHRSLILAAMGELRAKSVHEADRGIDFYDLKGDVEDILRASGLEQSFRAEDLPAYYHPGRAVRAGSDAILGELHPEIAEAYKFRARVYIAELDVRRILQPEERPAIAAIPKFPAIRRDLSLLVGRETRYADIESTVLNLRIPELVRIEPFDRLEAGPFASSRYALAISLTYQSPGRTLTDEEVAGYDRAILNSLKEHLDVEVRQ